MRIAPILGWGFVIYAVPYLVWTILSTHGMTVGTIPVFIQLCALAFTTLVAGSALRLRAWQDILPYSVSWMLMFVIFAVLTTPLPETAAHQGMLGSWVQYALVALAPLFAPMIHFESFSIGKWES